MKHQTLIYGAPRTVSPEEVTAHALDSAHIMQKNLATLAEELGDILNHPEAKFSQILGWVNRLSDVERKLTTAVDWAARSAGLATEDDDLYSYAQLEER